MRALEKSAQLDPANPDVWFAMASFCNMHRDIASSVRAEEAFKKCLEIIRRPETQSPMFFYSKDEVEVDCLLGLAVLRYKARSYSEAKQIYEQALAADVNHHHPDLIQQCIDDTSRKLQAK